MFGDSFCLWFIPNYLRAVCGYNSFLFGITSIGVMETKTPLLLARMAPDVPRIGIYTFFVPGMLTSLFTSLVIQGKNSSVFLACFSTFLVWVFWYLNDRVFSTFSFTRFSWCPFTGCLLIQMCKEWFSWRCCFSLMIGRVSR